MTRSAWRIQTRHLKAVRCEDWIDRRTARVRDPAADLLLVDAVLAKIIKLPTYGHRHAGALVNRIGNVMRMLPVNHTRFYRVMKAYHLLRPKPLERSVRSRRYSCKVAAAQSNTRSCSDGFEIACENGQVVSSTVTKDYCDHEIIFWRARPGRGLPGEPVREMLIADVEAHFGNVEAC